MTMLRISALAIALVAGAAQTASALPMQTLPQWMAWATHVGRVSAAPDDMSGGTMRTIAFRVGARHATLWAEIGAGLGATKYPDRMVAENLYYTGLPDTFDILKHVTMAPALLRAAYGPAIAQDYAKAKRVGDFGVFDSTYRVVLSRGARYAYRTMGAGVTVFPAERLPDYIAEAKQCQAGECGD